MTKLVYIIGNEHGSVFTQKEELPHLEKKVTVTSGLIKILAVNEKITNLFLEGTTEENLNDGENYLAKLADLDEKKAHDLVQETIKKNVDKDPQVLGLEIYEELAKTRRLGINIKFYPTECIFFDDEIKLLEEFGKLFVSTDKSFSEFIKDLKEITKDLSENDRAGALYEIPTVNEFLNTTRDFYIYSNLKKYSGEKNIIYIGRAHKLKEISRDKEFKSFRIDVADEINGSMPKKLEEEIETYLSEKKVKSRIIYT